jgi:3-methyl-2-oxobutanoate hydroxymethyltransferase
MKRFSISDLAAWKKDGKRWAVITSYDSVTSAIFDEAGIPVLLVGDSAGNNFLGEENTVPVTVDELIPLARAVVRGSKSALVVADLPFGSYELSKEQALETAIRFMKEAKVQAVKLEGGVRVADQVSALVKFGIPVMGHIGLTPQSVNALGGFKVQGRNDGQKIIEDAKALEAAGCFAIVLELIPAELSQQISEAISIPTIGIGAGKDCDAQVLVWTDLMGLTPKAPRFARKYRNLREEMKTAVQEWIADIESGSFPNESETFH